MRIAFYFYNNEDDRQYIINNAEGLKIGYQEYDWRLKRYDIASRALLQTPVHSFFCKKEKCCVNESSHKATHSFDLVGQKQ